MGILHLSVELALDLIALISGIILIIRAKDNYPQLYWGVIAVGIGFMFSWENIGWLTIVTDTPEYDFTELLNIDKMLKWYALANIVALFPIASLSPGYFNHFRIFTFLLPPIITITVGICYLYFNGNITAIHSLNEIMPNIGNMDVKLRISIFLLSVITPLFILVYVTSRVKTHRKMNRNMYLFMGFLFLFLGIYILFTLSINEFIFNLFGITAIVFTVLFSMLYLRYENPFSDHISMVYNTEEEENPEEMRNSFQPLTLFTTIESYLKKEHPYTDQKYSIKDLAEALNDKERNISDAIKSQGFTGFREYINYIRLEHFKQLVVQNPEKNVKELMFACGFNSRATFYRNFSERYGISPSKFIEYQQSK